MTTQTWHADRDLLAAYVAGALDPIERRLGRAAPRPLRRVPRRTIRPLVDAPMPRPRLGRDPRRGREPGAAVARSGSRGGSASPSRPRSCSPRPRRCAPPGWPAPSWPSAFARAGGATGRAAAPSRRSCSSRRSSRCSASPPPTARTRTRWSRCRDRAVRPHPADPAPHPRRPRLGAPVRDRRSASFLPGPGVARGRLARAGARAGPGAAGAVQLRRPARRRRCRRHRLERRRAALRPARAGHLAGRADPAAGLRSRLAAVSVAVLFVRSRQDRQIGAVL